MKSWFLALTLFCLAFTHCAAPAKPSPWEDLALEDLRFIRDTLKNNTPNAVDDANPQFKDWLDRGFAKSSAMAQQIDSQSGLLAVVTYYLSGFKDPHIDLIPTETPETLLWPGFIARYNGSKLTVVYLDPSVRQPIPLAVGDEILSVDHRFPKDLILANVFPYRNAPENWEPGWRQVSPYLFVDTGNPFITPPKHIEIKTKNGEASMPLVWEPIQITQFDETLDKIMRVQDKQWEIKPFASGNGAWITLPSFGAKDPDQLKRIKEVIGESPSLRTKKYVVLDVRGNGGGQSIWGTQLLEGLYGKDFIDQILQKSGQQRSYDEWRVSKDNLEILKTKYLPFLRANTGEDTPVLSYIEETIENMESELKKGNNGLVKATYKPSPEVVQSGQTAPLYKGKLVLVTDSWCGSSCLTFVGEVLSLPNVLHVGQETSGYSPYVEARQVELPSKLGKMLFPMKVIRSPAGKPNQPYAPSIVFPGDINNTFHLTRWLEGVLKRQ